MLSNTFPKERLMINKLNELQGSIQNEITRLIENLLPLPERTEIQDRLSGEWSKLSDTARSAANKECFYDNCLNWHNSWKDLWSRLRIPD